MRYNGSINGVQNNSSLTSSPGMWSINDVQENSTDANWPGYGTDGVAFFEYLIVGGGGGGGGATSSDTVGGGGGGGQVLSGTGPINTISPYHINVGSGGPSGSGFSPGINGQTTTLTENNVGVNNFEVEALGGGGGSGYNNNTNPQVANGGGGSGGNGSSPGITGTAYNGGNGGEDTNDKGGGGGGAGAGGNGYNGTAGGPGGAGGGGLLSTITGASVYYGAGGGGGSNGGSRGEGGIGGGGPGGAADSVSYLDKNGERATVRSTGGGGGGAAVYGSQNNSANGGTGENGCVILKYPNMYDLHMDYHEGGTGPDTPINVVIKNHPNGTDKVATFIGRSQNNIYWVTSASTSAKEF